MKLINAKKEVQWKKEARIYLQCLEKCQELRSCAVNVDERMNIGEIRAVSQGSVSY